MMRGNHLVKSTAAILVPALLFALLTFQVYRCKNILVKRNSYLLETLPTRANWIWDATAGSVNLELSTDSAAEQDSDKLVSGSPQNSTGTQVSLKKPGIVDDPQNYHSAVLLPGIPTVIVHYLWCIDGYFELTHYISILSTIYKLRPDKIVIHYRSKPRTDHEGYWRWLEDLQQNVVMLSFRQLSNPRHCSHDFSKGVPFDAHDFHDPYGIFLLDDIVVSNLSREYVIDLIRKSFSGQESLFSLKTHQPVSEKDLRDSQVFLVPTSEPFHMIEGPGRVVIPCPSINDKLGLKNKKTVHCLNVNSYQRIEELFTRDTYFHRYARNIMYGSPEPVQVKMAHTEQIPNIVHIVLINGVGEITPLLYTSIKSAYVRGQALQVYIHGPNPPTGPLWDKLLHFHDDLKPKYIPTSSLKQFKSRHAAFKYTLYTLLQHGGIAHFGDVVFLRPIPSSSRRASAIATLHFSQYRLRHRSTNTAILAGAKGSQFIETMLAMAREEDQTWPYSRADDIATHVGEMYPSSVLLDFKLVTHQNCMNKHCQVAGGHQHPHEFYTTRLVWNGDDPETLEQLKMVEGPSRGDIIEIVDT